MKILVTNDDGIDSPGIKALAKALKEVRGAEVIVVAPDREQSAKSHSLTLHRPLRLKKVKKDFYAVDGTPTDCVFLAQSIIYKNGLPDFVFSGINRGGNLGDDVHYSGTVSAAVEGGLIGVPSVALSQLGLDKFNFAKAAEFSKKILKLILKNPLPKGIILNVNVPENCKSLDYQFCKTGKRNYGKAAAEKIDPRGRPYYWVGGDQYEFFDIPGSDCNVIQDGKISVTPIRVNWTSNSVLKKMQAWKK